ncbi:hypothetical protein D3C81_2039000 [compost metagenome]
MFNSLVVKKILFGVTAILLDNLPISILDTAPSKDVPYTVSTTLIDVEPMEAI